jgi:hypothetical protein
MAVWKSLTVHLPAETGGWVDSSVGTVSVWGNGNDGKDLWGYHGANAIVHVHNIVANANDTAQVKIDLLSPPPEHVHALRCRDAAGA